MGRMRYKGTMIAVLVLLALTVSVVLAANPFVDGNIAGDEGWQGMSPHETDLQESDIPSQYNIRNVWLRSSDDDAALFIGVDVYDSTGILLTQGAFISLGFDSDNDSTTGGEVAAGACPNTGAEYRVRYFYNYGTGQWNSVAQYWDANQGAFLFNGSALAAHAFAWETAVDYGAMGVTPDQPMGIGIHFENSAIQNDDNVCFTWNPENGGGDGCTPGYWKQSQHFDSWVSPYSPYEPQTYFDVIFGVGPHVTLLQALGTGGGGENALGRHAVAALLNAAANSGVDYFYTAEDVIQMVRDVYGPPTGDFEGLKDLFAYENELGCPLD